MNACPKASEINKYLMWSKINQLKREGHSVNRIYLLTGHDRKTIRKYLKLSEAEFRSQGYCVRHYKSRLDKYRDFIVSRLRMYPFLSSASIHSQLRRSFPDLEKFNQKTVYNYVQRLRREENIPKENEGNNRPYCMLEQTAPAEYAQADFGERWIDLINGEKKKVYFFVLVLCRWRHKFVWFSEKPFTSELAAYAHELAFEFFCGVPHNIVYDQDKVLLSDENMGDYILTSRFKQLVGECGFNPIFCRKSDPESKGKVENVVKYVKRNFLSGYVFNGMDNLNIDCMKWLDTTANGLPHSTTTLIPAVMYNEEEKDLMLPYTGIPTYPTQEMPTYTLRKDHTISYKGNYYAVPIGTYHGRGSCVRVLEKDSVVEIYSIETGKMIISHGLCLEKGRLISNGSCRRNPHHRIEDLENQIFEQLGKDDTVCNYLQTVRRFYPRNVRDNFAAIMRGIGEMGSLSIHKAMELHLAASYPGVNAMIQTARNIGSTSQNDEENFSYHPLRDMNTSIQAMIPEKTQMGSYASIFI